MSEMVEDPGADFLMAAEAALEASADASAFLDVVTAIPLAQGSGRVKLPRHSHILTATVDPRGGPTLWIKGPVDAGTDTTDWPEVTIFVVHEGEPAPRFNTAYLATLTLIEQPTIVAPGAQPRVHVYHIFADLIEAADGEIALGKL